MKPRMVALMLMAVVAGGAAEPSAVPIKPSPSKGPVQKAAPARYVTSQQIKVYWYNQLPVPSTMDRDYHPAMKARAAFVAEIRAGEHDLAAEKTAAQYNKQEALRVGDMERAKMCEVEIARITQQEMEIARQQQQQQRAAETMIQMNRLDARLREISSNLGQIRDVIWAH